jgi:ABC-type sugar transport system permease subunit
VIDKRMLFWFLAPSIALYVGIFVYPTISTLYLSFFSVGSFLATDAVFVGIRNYLELFTTPLFISSLVNIAIIWSAGGLIVFGVSFLFVALLRTLPQKAQSFFRAMIFLPNIINVVAVVTIWTQYVYNPRGGMLVTLFNALGLPELAQTQWTGPENVFWAMTIAYVWGSLGWFAVIIMAGEKSIPADLYEAARLDGAKPANLFFDITLPLLADVMRVAVVMWTVTVINLFAFVKAFNPIATSPQTYTPAVYLYELAFGAQLGGGNVQVGKSAAAATILLVLVVVSAALIERLMRRERVEF